jgi:hypothetical protein
MRLLFCPFLDCSHARFFLLFFFQIPRSTRKSVVTMRLVHTVAVWAMMSLLLNAQSVFNLYPDVDPAMLSASLGFSETCLVAM